VTSVFHVQGQALPALRDLDAVGRGRMYGASASYRSQIDLNRIRLLGIDRDRRLAGGECRLHLGVDVLELPIAVGMLRALAGLAVGLTAIVQLAPRHADQLLARLKALLAQHRGDVALAPADPAQRRPRIAADRALDQPFERRQKAKLTFNAGRLDGPPSKMALVANPNAANGRHSPARTYAIGVPATMPKVPSTAASSQLDESLGQLEKATPTGAARTFAHGPGRGS
jgi:hypothetical protein